MTVKLQAIFVMLAAVSVVSLATSATRRYSREVEMAKQGVWQTVMNPEKLGIKQSPSAAVDFVADDVSQVSSQSDVLPVDFGRSARLSEDLSQSNGLSTVIGGGHL